MVCFFDPEMGHRCTYTATLLFLSSNPVLSSLRFVDRRREGDERMRVEGGGEGGGGAHFKFARASAISLETSLATAIFGKASTGLGKRFSVYQ